MRRQFVFGVLLLAIAALSVDRVAYAQDADLKMRAVGDNVGLLFLFEGDDGPHVLAFGAEDPAITIIDPRGPGLAETIVRKVHNGADGPVTTIINTNARRAGSNSEFLKATTIIAHENTKAAMAKLDAFKGANAKFLPNKTFTDTLSLTVKTVGEEDGTNRLNLYHCGPAYSDGDTVVVFLSLNTVYMGDLFPGRMVPLIDTENGGSALAFPDTLAKAVTTLKAVPGLKIVMPGREPAPPGPYVPTWLRPAVLDDYLDFTRDLVAAVKTAFEAGKSPDEAVAGLKLPDRYKNYDMTGVPAFVMAAYGELKR